MAHGKLNLSPEGKMVKWVGNLARGSPARAWPICLPFEFNKPIEERDMSEVLAGKKVAILVANGFEESELEEPRAALEEAGAETDVVSPENGEVQGWSGEDFGDAVGVDVRLKDARAESYDALLLPGGVMNPDKLRTLPEAVQFVRSFFDMGKPVAAICHGPILLIEAKAVEGRTLTSYPSIKTDLINAGATWLDQEVVVDEGLVTSRRPADLPAFNQAMIEEFAEQVEEGEPG
jgi:protease I